MKRYFKMKWEQFLMRFFDWFLQYLKTTDVDWYPRHVLCYDLEDQVHKLEMKLDRAEILLIEKDEEIESLSQKLYFYEPWNNNEDES